MANKTRLCAHSLKLSIYLLFGSYSYYNSASSIFNESGINLHNIVVEMGPRRPSTRLIRRMTIVSGKLCLMNSEALTRKQESTVEGSEGCLFALFPSRMIIRQTDMEECLYY